MQSITLNSFMVMRTDNNFFGMINGAVGNVTLYVRNGKQVIAQRARQIGNPRTDVQMMQRIKLANVLATYRLLRDLLRTCFEPVDDACRTSLATVYNRFTSVNLLALPVFLTRWQAREGGCVAAPYRVSDGSLTAINVTDGASGARTDILLGGLELTDETTVACFTKAVIGLNPLYEQGDSIAYMHLSQALPGDTGIPRVTPLFCSLRLDAADMRPLRSLVPALGFSSQGGCLGQGSAADACAFAWIHTRPGSKGVLASTQQLVAHNRLFDEFGSPRAAREALDSYHAREVPVAPVVGVR